MMTQPVGAGGQVLGARKIVTISVTLDATGKSICVPCYVLDSGKPLWQEVVRNCGLVLGTNAMTAFGMQVLHSNGTVICPSPIACEESGEKVQPSGEVTELSQESSEQPESTSCTSGDEQITSKDTGRLEQLTRVILSQIVHLGLRHTKEVKVEIRQFAGMGSGAEMLGIIVPDEECLAEHKCNFAGTLWRGEPKLQSV